MTYNTHYIQGWGIGDMAGSIKKPGKQYRKYHAINVMLYVKILVYLPKKMNKYQYIRIVYTDRFAVGKSLIIVGRLQ
jgi:hypothetical protein